MYVEGPRGLLHETTEPRWNRTKIRLFGHLEGQMFIILMKGLEKMMVFRKKHIFDINLLVIRVVQILLSMKKCGIHIRKFTLKYPDWDLEDTTPVFPDQHHAFHGSFV